MVYVIGILIVMGLVGTGVGYWKGQGDGKAIAERVHIAAQRDALADLNQRLDEANREKREQNAKFLALPDVRNRLCSIQGQPSGCCQPEPAECKP